MPGSESAVSLASLLSSATGAGGDPSDTWGNVGFKGCRMCRRPRSTPNPIPQDGKPTLAFKSDRHHLCLPCIGCCRTKDPELIQSPEKRNAFIKELGENDAAHDSHMKDLELHEQSCRQLMGKRVKSGKRVPDEAGLDETPSGNFC